MSAYDAELEAQAALYGGGKRERHAEPEDSHRVDQLRIPPQSVEAEQAVLGGLMLVPHAWSEVADLLTPESFYRRDHALIWKAIHYLQGRDRPFDAVTLGEWFDRQGLSEQVDHGRYLVMLTGTTPSAVNIRAHAEIVADKARLRQIAQIGTQLENDAYDPAGRDSVEIVGQAQTALGNLMQSEPCELEELTPVMNRMFDNLQRRYDLKGALDGLSTGLTELDRVLNGLKGGRLYVIAARPKQGKTTLALNIAEEVAVRQRKPVSVFSLEMPQEELAERLTCSIGLINHQSFRTGQLEDEDWNLVTAAVRKLKAVPLRLSKPRNVRIESLVAQARRLHARKPQALFVVDYLQLLETRGSENRTQGMSEVSRQLKMLAIDLDVPVIAVSQLNRDLEKRTDKRPIMSDLRDSGAIEQDADAIVFLYRDELYNRDSPDKGTTEIIVGAQRNGPAETVRVATRLHYCRFDDLADDWKPKQPEPKEQKERKRTTFPGGGNTAKDRAAGDA